MSTANLPCWDPYYAKITPFDPLKTPFDYQEGVTVFDDEEESCPYFTRLKKWQLMYDREMGSETGTDQEGLPEMSPELKESYPVILCVAYSTKLRARRWSSQTRTRPPSLNMRVKTQKRCSKGSWTRRATISTAVPKAC